MALGMQKNDQFYDSMANHFHLIFEDWNASMRRQGAVIAKLLPSPEEAGLILDVACGIGTQSLALAALGYSVEGSDISAAEVARAQREAASRGLKCSFRVDDMRTLRTASIGRYGAVIAMDNALPHLDSDDDIRAAFTAMRMRLLPGGKVLVSVRDYARHLKEKHTCRQCARRPAVCAAPSRRPDCARPGQFAARNRRHRHHRHVDPRFSDHTRRELEHEASRHRTRRQTCLVRVNSFASNDLFQLRPTPVVLGILSAGR